LNIADIFGSVRLNLETGQFEAQALKATDNVTAKMGQRLKGAAGGILGAGLGAAFGMMLSGANQLDSAARQLAADAGLTAEESKAASSAMAGMYRDNLQGFDQIGRAMASVHNDLGLVGKAADKATAKFLKYATATGQDATAAVMAFDDVLDAWNLTADDASGLMDGLIADHQKFGGVIGDSQRALAAMAPAMQAANMSIDDGRALLNLFNAAGIDAAKAPAALAKAVKELKPGQSLNDLIAQIGAIEDPTLRAQEAMRIFGARSGIGLAQAIQPGMTSLDAFGVSATEAAGKTEEAAKVIEDSFSNKVALAMKKVQGTLAEFGTGMGDLVMVAALFGPKMTTALLAGFGGLTGKLTQVLIPRVTAAILATGPGAAIASSTIGTAAGTAFGTAMGAAIPLALVAAAGIGIALAFKAIVLDPGLQQQSRDIGKAVGEQIVTGATDQLEQSKAAIEQGITDINNLPLGGFLYGDQVRDLQAQLDAVNAEIAARAAKGGETVGAAATEGVATGIEGGVPVVEIAADKVVETFGTNMAGVKAALGKVGFDGMSALAQGITAARQAPLDAFTSLKDMLKNAMTPQAEQLRLHGQLLSKTLAAGLRSGDPAVRAQAQATAQAIANRLAELSQSGGKAGREAMKALDQGVRSKIPAVRAASLAAKKALDEKLAAAKGSASTAGKNAGSAFSAGVTSGVSTGFTFTGSFRYAGKLKALAKGGPIETPSWVGEEGPEVYVPERAGRILSHDDAMAAVSAGAAGGRAPAGAITVNVYNPAPEPASTSTRRELRKLALSGSAA